MRHPSASDIKFIEQQLGREPRGVIEISARCRSGHPSVIKTKPILVGGRQAGVGKDVGRVRRTRRDEFFPTLYYLVCGKLIKEVFKLESEGFINKLQRKVDSDKEFRTRFLEAEEDYMKERNVLCRAGSPNTPQVGIGGVRKLDKIKCLHAHLAHYLATDNNPVGEEVAKIVGSTCQ